MINAVEEFLDVQIKHPVILPTAPPACPDRIQRRTARPVTIGIRMEHRLHPLFEFHGHHRLGDSVRHRRHTQNSHPAMRFRYLHRLHRRRKVTPRGHPVPNPIKVVLQIGFEVLDRAPVHSRRSLVGLDSPVRLPHQVLGNTERLFLRLWFAHSIPSQTCWLPEQTAHGWSDPFAPPLLQRLQHYYGPVRMPIPRRYSIPHGFRRLRRSLSPSVFPLAVSGLAFPRSVVKAADRARVAYMPGTAWPVNRVSARLILEPSVRSSSDAI